MLCRGVGAPWVVAAVVLTGLIALQSPRALGASEFFWPSVHALTLALVATVPLVWALGRADRATHLIVDPARTAIGWSLGIFVFGALLVTIPFLASITLKRIETDPSQLRALLVLAPLAALGPGLASLAARPAVASLVWAIVLGGSIGIFGIGIPIPVDSLVAGSKTVPSAAQVVAALMSTLGGILLSMAATRQRGTRVG